jgi:hypothetical protein
MPTVGCQMKSYAMRALRQVESSAQESIWEAHRGCAALAGALLIEDKLVDDDAHASIRTRIESILGSPRAEPARPPIVRRADFVQRILRELETEAEAPKEIGHDVIYSGYVLRALDAFDIDPWESLLEGLTRLIRLVKSSGPGWITVNGRNEVREPGPLTGSDGRDYWSIFCRFDRPLTMEVGDMQLGHLLTHGHAISMMQRYCTPALIRALDIAYHRRLHLLAAANKEEQDQTALRRQAIDPRAIRYWEFTDRFGDMHGHTLKYAYSFLDLRRSGIASCDLEAFGRIVWPAQPAAVIK